ncbi:hypothetical protein [Aquibaculum sediminis]|uniref:hypothetical protein n=1 Tax=Aquibaculum sediminis TaxID=3231907 RepID=UPI003454E0DD
MPSSLSSAPGAQPAAPSVGPAAATPPAPANYVDWGAIVGGALFAAALSFVLITFGSAIGLTMMSAEPGEGISLRWATIAAGIWFIWVAISSFAAGGYIAGRLRRPLGDAPAEEVETRDGGHGLLVWALGTLLALLMASSGIGGILGGASSAAGSLAGSASEMATEEIEGYASRMLRSDGVLPSAEARSEIASVLSRSLAAGEVSEEDRTHLANIVAAETELSPEQAQAQVETVATEAEELRAEALEMAEQLRIAGVIGAFIVAATLLISAAAAYFGATTGGQHRDRRISFRHYGRPY